MWLSFCSFFAPQGPSWPEGGFWLTLKTTVVVGGPFVSVGVPGLLFLADLSRRGPKTRNDVRGTTQKSVVPRSARRLASCEATPAVFGGSQNGWRPTDGPLSWPPKRPLRDLRVVPTCASSTAYACDVASPKLVQDGRLG